MSTLEFLLVATALTAPFFLGLYVRLKKNFNELSQLNHDKAVLLDLQSGVITQVFEKYEANEDDNAKEIMVMNKPLFSGRLCFRD